MLTELSLILTILTMGIGAIGLWALYNQGSSLIVRRWSECTAVTSLLFALVFSAQVFLTRHTLSSGLFQLEILQAILVPYILIMGIVVKRFAYHYLQSDEHYPLFFLKIKALIFSLLLFVVANHAMVLLFAWILSGWVLCKLIHHTETQASRNAAKHSWKTFMLGDIAMGLGLLMLSSHFDSFLINDWTLSSATTNPIIFIGLTLLIVSALTKTANIPFCAWLPHTLIAPTPVSAIMHAGFVNSGAILFAKISPILVQFPLLMGSILVIGLLSALWGSFAMMVQPDIKRYLTYSTIGQMGFMIMECGLGAFHLAIGHLILHGLFKSRLFLASGNVIEQRRAIKNTKHRINNQWHGNNSTILATGVVLTTSIFYFLLFQSPLGKQFIELPSVLLITLIFSAMFSQIALLKTKGVGILGIVLATIFSMTLLMGYITYDNTATKLLSDLNLYHYTKEYPIQNLVAWIVGSLGVLTLLISNNVITVPKTLKTWGYVHLLNANNKLKKTSSFSHRSIQY